MLSLGVHIAWRLILAKHTQNKSLLPFAFRWIPRIPTAAELTEVLWFAEGARKVELETGIYGTPLMEAEAGPFRGRSDAADESATPE